MAAKILLLVACVALSHAAMVKRDAPAPSAFAEIQTHATEFLNTIGEQFNSIINSKNTEQVNKALKEGSDSVVQQLGTFASSLQSAIPEASGKVKESLEATKANLERTAEELRKSHPDIEQHANALKESIQAAVQNAVTDSKKLAEEAAKNMDETNKKLAPQVQAAYQEFVKKIQEVQKTVREAATKQ